MVHSVSEIPESLNALWNCEWTVLLENPIVSEIYSGKFLNTPIDGSTDILPIGIAALQAFVQDNFLGPLLESNHAFTGLSWQSAVNELNTHTFRNYLLIDGEEINRNARYPELLALAKFLFAHIAEQCKSNELPLIESFVKQQWLLRFNGIYQSVVDENCATLYKNITTISSELYRLLPLLSVDLNKESAGICLLEIVQWQLHYRQINKAKEYLDHAQRHLDVNVMVEGRLGKRTKHQIDAKPILTVCVAPASENADHTELFESSLGKEHSPKLPTLLQLDDEVLLERPRFENEADNAIFNTKRDIQALVLAI